MSTQDLAVISVLADMGNGEVKNATTDLPKVTGQQDAISTTGRIVQWDAEWHWDATYTDYPHQALGGHLVLLGLTEAHQIWEEYTYPVINWARQQGGVAGFAHLQYLNNGIPQDLNCCLPIEYPIEVALGSAQFISEDVTGDDSAMLAYYRLLNCGFRPGFAGGSDTPCSAVMGAVLTYVRVDGTLTYRKWVDGIAAGHTVVSRNGHQEFLDLKVGTTQPGDEIQLASAGNVTATVVWTAKDYYQGTIELVQNGTVVASKTATVDATTPATLTATINVAQSGWIAARRMSDRGHEVQTGAVFVIVNGAPIRTSVTDAQFYMAWADSLLTKTDTGGVWGSFFPTSRTAARARYQAAKDLFAQIAVEAAVNQPLTITNSSLIQGVLNQTYSAPLATSGGTAPLTWSMQSGALPAGLSLNTTTGVIAGTPTVGGTSDFTIKVTDSSSPVKTATKALSITVNGSATAITIWPISAVPANPDGGADSPVELGVRFRSDVGGYITGIRFYKASTNTGAHSGRIWSTSGTQLATATFVNESASGWQQVNFTTPLSITAGTTYVASYHCASGHYSADTSYFSSLGVDTPPLHAPADGASGSNGIYSYGSAGTFPTSSWSSANYWVDVVFIQGAPPTLTSIALTPNGATITPGATQQFSATGTYSDGSTQAVTGQATWTSSSTTVASITSGALATGVNSGSTTITATIGAVSGSTTLTVQTLPLTITTSSLASGVLNTTYTGSLAGSGGRTPYAWSIASGAMPTGLTLNSSTGAISGTPTAAGTFNFSVGLADSSSPVQTVSKAFSIVVTASSPVATLWLSTTVPVVADDGADSAVELGVRFKSDVAGTVTGVRFYKSAANTGAHIGNLWSSTGTKLATANFASETASGWQQVLFSTPVAITANTTYIVSYHSVNGHYAADLNYFATTGVDRAPLHAPATTVSAPNGVYAYGASSTFPSLTWNAANYWVDVVFQGGAAPTLSSIAVAPASATIFVGNTQALTATGTYSDGSTQNLTSQVTWSSSGGAATVNSSGVVTGVSAGSATITASFSGKTSTSAITVQATPVSISTTTLAAGVQNTAYSAPLTGAGGTVPYIWSIATGSLPTGITLNTASGLISGTPTVLGTFNFTVGISDSTNPIQTASKALAITINSAPVTLVSIAVTPAGASVTVGQTQQFTATGTYSNGTTQNLTSQADWSSSSTARATISAAGLATTVSPGATTITATVSSISNSTTLTVLPAPLAISTASLGDGALATAYSASLTATGGTTPYSWSVNSGTFPAGLSLNATTGAISGSPTAAGTFAFAIQVSDAGNPVQSVVKSFSIVVAATPASITIWPNTSVPALADGGADNPVELGVKFRSDVAGKILGIRFYKASTNTGAHIGNLWSSTGTKLATANFSSETSSGWQQVTFTTPVTVAANTTYVASYHCNVGHYAADIGYFTGVGFDRAPLHALASGVSGANGIYAYGTTSTFPTDTWQDANYWVDVIFQPNP